MNRPTEIGILGLVAISEAARADLYTGLSKAIGPKRAETLMSVIPLHEFDEVATKGDVATLRAELEAKMSELEARLTARMGAESAALHKSFTNWMLTMLVAIVGAMIGVGVLT